jgi:hypothetical protein
MPTLITWRWADSVLSRDAPGPAPTAMDPQAFAAAALLDFKVRRSHA